MPQPTTRFEGMHAAEQLATIDEIVALAKQRVDPATWTYLTAGAADERTTAANRHEFQHWWLVPRYEPAIEEPSCATTFFEVPVPLPIFTAPFGLDHLLAPEGILAVARAHRDLPIPLVVSRSTAASLEDVAETAVGVPLLFQLLPTGTEEDFVGFAHRAREAGYLALVVTLDGSALGLRDRVRRERFAPDMSTAWGNFRHSDGSLDEELLGRMEQVRRPQLSYQSIGDCARAAGLPWIAKGILSVTEALTALDAGASAIYVSNHGGRALDSVPPTLAVLPEIATAVAERAPTVPVLLDGGVRRGNDVLKALCLEADFVGVGGLVAAALAAGGEAAVARLLELLHEEICNGMLLLGRHSLAELGADCVRPV